MDAMREIKRGIHQYRNQHSVLPENLSEIRLLISDGWIEAFDTENQPLDPWGHPYVYQASGEDYQLLSYGRDGAPGGATLDEDFSSEPPQERPGPGSATLRQFTFELPTGRLQQGCLLAGACTAIAIWVLLRKTAGASLFFRLAAWGMTLWSAFFGATLMASLHVAAKH